VGERSEALARRFEQVNGELDGLVESLSADEWKAICKGETWSVGVTAHHIAYDQAHIINWFQAIANGRPLPPPAPGGLDASTARHAAEHANCTKEETLKLLRRDGEAAAMAVRELTDEQLDRQAPVADGRPALTAGGVVERILIGHALGHGASIRAAIGREARAAT
jgi:uncharacterized damage-inducible protein DinB